MKLAAAATALLGSALALVPAATSHAATSTLRPVADAYADSSRTNRNFGSANRLQIADSPLKRAYLRFDLRGITQTVTKATLQVQPDASSATGVDVRPVPSVTWTETGLTWANQPAFSGAIGTTGRLTTRVTASVDVTAQVRAGQQVSFALTHASSTTIFGAVARASRSLRLKRRRVTARAAAVAMALYSDESGTRGPKLVVVTQDAPPPPPPPDTTAPSVGLTAPADGADVGGTVTVSADAGDNVGVARVEFSAGATSLGSDDAAPYEATWNTTTAPDGPVTLTARAVDAAGNAAAATRTVTVKNAVTPPPPTDTTAPQTSIDGGPSDTQRSGQARFLFSSSESGSRFECRLDGAAFAACTSGAGRHVANGKHVFEIRAIDAAGNVDPTPARREWWADALLENGLFEASMHGWRIESTNPIPGWATWASTAAILDGGVEGRKARVTAGSGAPTIYSAPVALDAVAAGDRYTANGFVRSDTAGMSVCLKVREYTEGGTLVAGPQSCVTATTDWRPFPEVVRTTAGNGNQLDVTVFGSAKSGSFDVDGLELSDGRPVTVKPPATPAGDPVLLATSDAAVCWSSGDEAVSRLLDQHGGTLAMVGDAEQNHASLEEFQGCYDPPFGRHNNRIRPAIGDHEYDTPGATGYWDYFGERAGPRGKGWYSYDLGAWHIVVLNSNCSEIGGCGPGSEQYAWLQADLAANAKDCTAAYFHYPLFSAGGLHGGRDEGYPFWELLYEHGAEFVLGGNDANYQRFAPMTPDGVIDRARGIRQFVVGTGGSLHYDIGAPLPATEVQHSGAFGLTKFTLGASSYSWQFIPQHGETFTDTGTTACAKKPEPDTTAPSVALTAPADGATVSGTVALTASASDDVGVARVEFRVDGGVVGTDTTAPYAADWDAGGAEGRTVSVTARAVDTSGNAAVSSPRSLTVPAPAPVVNLMTNGSFEDGLTGWGKYRATLTLLETGVDGARSARLGYAGTGTSYSLLTSAYTVGTTTAGEVYSGSAWIRSETPGKRVCLRLREWRGGTAIAGQSTCATATSDWQRLPAAVHTAVGGDALELYMYSDQVAAGDSFDIDGVTLSKR